MQWQRRQLNQYTVEWTRPSASMSSLLHRGHRTLTGGSGSGNISACNSNFAARPKSDEKPPVFDRCSRVSLRRPRLFTDSETLELLTTPRLTRFGSRLA